MYNKLSACHKKKCTFEDDGPPEKKLLSDGDIIIKQLSEKQRNTKVNLDEQLSAKSQFYKSTEVQSVTNYTSGSVSLEQFNSTLQLMNDIEKLKSCGLSNEEIQFMRDCRSGEAMKEKHRNLNEAVRIERLANIHNRIKQSENDCIKETVKSNGLKAETSLALKPTSTETKLLKFALENNRETKEKLPGPMDEIKNVEQKLIDDLSVIDIKKIRKKARSLARQIETLSNPPLKEPPAGKSKIKNPMRATSKWDLKECQPEKQVEEHKVFTCKPQNYYTIKNGQIVKLDKVQNTTQPETRKLSEEEIKNVDKFRNYEKGTPSRVLYLKNLSGGVQDADLKSIMGDSSKFIISINIMKGRMRGQAFIEFQDVTAAGNALDECNGTILRGKPVVIQFGKQK